MKPRTLRRGAWLLMACTFTLVSACDQDEQSAPARRERFVAVKANEPAQDPLETWCDVRTQAKAAPPLALPPLDGPLPEAPAQGWRWINIWATWCKPCVEEMPMLADWQGRLTESDVNVQLVFVSVDADADALARHREAHPRTPQSLRLTDASQLPELLASLGLDAGATIPIQVFVDPAGRRRCVRTGAVGDADYDTVRALLARP